MKASIIITIYNEEKYIRHCLQSLKNQSFKEWELIIVDDGSKDNSLVEVEKAGADFKIKNLRVFKQEHQGLAKARNRGAEKAKGEILVFLDGDMFFEKDFLTKLIKPIEQGIVKGTFSTEEYVANWDNVWARCWNYNWNLPEKRRIDPQRTDQRKEFRAILKKEYVKVSGLDSLGYTDAWSLSEKLGYGPKEVMAKYYHYNPGNLTEVFFQAKWAAKRKYKLGFWGKIISLIRANPVFSFINGLRKGVAKREAVFVIFKLVYDFGITLGLLEKKKHA